MILASSDLEIKREMVDDDLQPGDPRFYPSLKYVYQNLQHAERAVDSTRDILSCQKSHEVQQYKPDPGKHEDSLFSS